MSYENPTREELADQYRESPTIVEVGIAPLRVTIPLTSAPRKKEAAVAGAVVVGLSAGLVIFGGKFIKGLVDRFAR